MVPEKHSVQKRNSNSRCNGTHSINQHSAYLSMFSPVAVASTPLPAHTMHGFCALPLSLTCSTRGTSRSQQTHSIMAKFKKDGKWNVFRSVIGILQHNNFYGHIRTCDSAHSWWLYSTASLGDHQNHDLIFHTVTLSRYCANQSLSYPIKVIHHSHSSSYSHYGQAES